jgi:serine/threonine protein kinase/tetratricopeptide (TPR) repeat protein
MIGPYRLLDRLGEGGMGEVWLAEQTEPVKRTVALKVIKQGMDTRQVVARFEAERQALAMMEHPAIAKVYEAGTTPSGRPYFVMEHVKGVPITEHCDRHMLTNRQRMDLFMEVCEGVQHAHHKAVIHRDLKPGNILVAIQNDKPVPKIIDFGVAKATAQKLTAQTMHTQLGVIVGTPAYMSPEQAEMTGQGVDTRTDVYALGVILYELLVGALPFDGKEFSDAGFEAMVRKIREDEPPKPSTRLSTMGEHSTESAKRRRTALPLLRRELSGDLDWITMKALEKDRTRRYSSPQDFAADIERYLADEPVLATPPSVSYRTRKFIKRHTWGVAAGAVGLAVLVAFAATMALQSKRIAAERDLAKQAQIDLESVVGFQAGMLSQTDPSLMGRRMMRDLYDRVEVIQRDSGSTDVQIAAALTQLDTLVGKVNATDFALGVLDEDILARAASALDERFADQPLIDARLRWTIGETYRRLGRYEKAEPHLEAAVEIRRRELGDNHNDTLDAMNNLAVLYDDQARYEDAETLYLETLETRTRVLGEDHLDTMTSVNNLASLYRVQARYDQAEPLYLKSLVIRKRILGEEHRDTLRTMNGLAMVYEDLERYEEAEELYVQTLEVRKRTFGTDHVDTLGSMNNLAIHYDNQGRHELAEPLILETLGIRRRLFGEDHPDTLDALNNLAVSYHNRERYAEALPLYVETLAARVRILGPDHPSVLDSKSNLGVLYQALGRNSEAEALHLENLEAHRRILGPDHPDTFASMGNLVVLYKEQGRELDVARLYLEYSRVALGDDHPETLEAINNLAYLQLTAEPAASRDLRSGLRLALEAVEKTRYENPTFLGTLALAHHLRGESAKSIETQAKALTLLTDESPDRQKFEEALARYEAAR